MSDAQMALPALEAAWMDAWVRKDRAVCEAILADDFLLTSARGVLMPKAAWLEGAMGAISATAFEWLELRVRALGDAVAVVHGRSRQAASIGALDWSGVFLTTDVWMLREGAWRVVSRHGTGPLAA